MKSFLAGDCVRIKANLPEWPAARAIVQESENDDMYIVEVVAELGPLPDGWDKDDHDPLQEIHGAWLEEDTDAAR